MITQQNDWLVVFRFKFDVEIEIGAVQFDRAPAADIWRFGPENVQLDDNGLPIFKSKSWGGMALFKSQTDAETFYSHFQHIIPTDLNTSEHWSALLKPTLHKGTVDWRGQVESDSAIATASPDNTRPLVVITSAGFVSQEPSELPRIKEFTTGSQRVLEHFENSDGFIRGSIFYAMFDGLDGITLTVWSDLEAMQRSAYKTSLHANMLHEHRQNPMADRISNTRADVVASAGSWDGLDLNEI